MGYSDITSLLTYIHDQTGLVMYHGPMVAKDIAKAETSNAFEWKLDETVNGPQVQSGNAQGKLYGGCLSMLVASLGTPYEIRTDGTMLFIEDVATKPYQIDRMLMHLRLAGKLAGVRGIIFGEMLDCNSAPNQGYTLEEVIMRVVGGLGVPVAFGLRSGHVSGGNITLPIGVKASLSVGVSAGTLEIREAATTV